MIFTIAARELRGMFLSPLAWTILAAMVFICAYMFLVQLETFLNLQPRLAAIEGAPGTTAFVVVPLFGDVAVLMLFVIPLITMRLFSEERRAATMPLLLSAPVSMTEVVVGKYAGAMGFVLVMLGLIALMPLSLLLGGALDLGLFAAGLMGLALLGGGFVAVGLFLSTLTAQPTAAGASTFGLLLLLWILDWTVEVPGADSASILAYLSALRHFQSLLQGIVDTADIGYFVLLIGMFLVLSVRRLDAERLQG